MEAFVSVIEKRKYPPSFPAYRRSTCSLLHSSNMIKRRKLFIAYLVGWYLIDAKKKHNTALKLGGNTNTSVVEQIRL